MVCYASSYQSLVDDRMTISQTSLFFASVASEAHIYLPVLWAWQRRLTCGPIRVRHSATRMSR